MDSNLRTDFKERQRKHLSEALPATPPPAKQSRPKAPHEEPVFERPHGAGAPFWYCQALPRVGSRTSIRRHLPGGRRGPYSHSGWQCQGKRHFGYSLKLGGNSSTAKSSSLFYCTPTSNIRCGKVLPILPPSLRQLGQQPSHGWCGSTLPCHFELCTSVHLSVDEVHCWGECGSSRF